MDAEILTIGDELCRGEIVDTNSSYLAARLWDLGITTRWMTSCNDRDEDLAAVLRQAVARAGVVICSGGLGPTEDDRTVDVAARLTGTAPVVDLPARQQMERWFEGRLEVTEIQLRQVRVPAGAIVYPNPAGLAPAFEFALGGVPVVCLPGVPRELHAIWEHTLATRIIKLREAQGDHVQIVRALYRVFGRGESQISETCRGLVDGVTGATIHYQVKFPETLVKLVVRDRDQAAAAGRLTQLDAAIRTRLAPWLYGTGEESLIDRAVRRLREANRTVATAESCTGGMVAEMLTRQPGSSSAFLGGAVVYANHEKIRQLGVSQATLDLHGAVSEPTVREMAQGAVERFSVDHAVAISGVAGPDGGTPDKPVGTVWLAVASRGSGQVSISTRRIMWPGTRDQVRTLAAWWAVAMVDAVIPSAETAQIERARWILEPRRQG